MLNYQRVTAGFAVQTCRVEHGQFLPLGAAMALQARKKYLQQDMAQRIKAKEAELAQKQQEVPWQRLVGKSGYGSIPINTIFRGMNIHLFTSYFDVNYRGTRFWHTAKYGWVWHINHT